MQTALLIIGIGYYVIAFLFPWHEGRRRTIGFYPALLIAFLIPLFGIFYYRRFQIKNRRLQMGW
jgi:hypothetical protein